MLTAATASPASLPDFGWAQREAAEALVVMMAPMMPHLAEECWKLLGHERLAAEAPWPTAEPQLLEVDTVLLPVQVNGKKRAELTIAAGASNAEVETRRPRSGADPALPRWPAARERSSSCRTGSSMWSRRDAILRGLALTGLLALGACQVRPLYAPTPDRAARRPTFRPSPSTSR